MTIPLSPDDSMKITLALFSIVILFSSPGWGQPKTEFISDPKNTPSLTVPEEARKSGISGEMVVWVRLDLDGNVIGVDSVSGPGPICRKVTRPDVLALRRAATEAAKLAEFEPVIEDGKRQRASGVVRFIIPALDTEQPSEDNNIVNLGLLSAPGKDGSENFLKRNAVDLPKAVYPAAARAIRAAGPVAVKVLIDESGSVFSAQAVSGHPLLRASATQAACQAEFKPTLSAGQPIKVTGVITYVFMP